MVSAAEAKAKFSELVSQAAHGGQRILIERHGKPFAALVRVADLERLEVTEPGGGQRLSPLALLGLWSDVEPEELDKIVADIYASCERDTGRKVEFEP